MTAAIHLADTSKAALCLPLMAQNHREAGLPYDDAHRWDVVTPILEGNPLGAIWLIGPARAPLGYVLVTFAWSMEAGGLVAWIAEMYIRPSVRKRGIGTETLHAIALALRGGGIKALHSTATGPDDPLKHFWRRAGFKTAQDLHVLTDTL